MSTNFYLVNKKHREIKEDIKNIIDLNVKHLREQLYKINVENKLYIEEEIDNSIETMKYNLTYNIFNAEEIHICQTSDSLVWFSNENFIDFKEFEEFYMENIDKYKIEDEYLEEYTLEEFKKKIKLNNK